MASSSAVRQSCASGIRIVAARCSVSASMASIQSASPGSKSSRNSAARSCVSGVPGSRRACTRVSNSLARDTREPKPKSAYSDAASISRQKARIMPCTSARRESFLSIWLSRCRSRSTGSGVLVSSAALSMPARGAWRSHSISRTSHRWRSACPALALAALTSAVRSQADMRRQCSKPGKTSSNSATAAWNGCASSVMQK